MRVGNFEIQVVGGREDPENRTVFLEHGQTYQVTLCNHTKRQRCDARLKIDGKEMGTFRINAASSFTLDRPAHVQGCFTFFRLGSPEAREAQIPNDERAGLLTVQFVPEALTHDKLFRDDVAVVAAPSVRPLDEDEDEGDGGTGFTGKSEQTFYDADDIFTYDPSASVRIELRMKIEEPLEIVDLSPKENPVPWGQETDPLQRIRSEIEKMAAALERDRQQDDYLAAESMERRDRLVELRMDLKLAMMEGRLLTKLRLNAPRAEYESLACTVFTCPDCQGDSKVPVGIGHIRIKCPHCDCRFVRKA